MIRKYQRGAKLLLTLVILAGIGVYFLAPKSHHQYRACALVRLHPPVMNDIARLADDYDGAVFEAQARVIHSLPVLTKTAEKMGLIQSVPNPRNIVYSVEELQLIQDLDRSIEVQRYGKTDIAEIYVTAESPETAKSLANHLSDAFVQYCSEVKSQPITDAANYIEQQLELYQSRLSGSEGKLAGFKAENFANISFSDLNVAALQCELDSLYQKQTALEFQIAQLQKRLFASDSSFIRWISNQQSDPSLSLLNEQLLKLELEKENLLVFMTPNAPAVVEVETQIQKLIKDVIGEFEVNLTQVKLRQTQLQERLANLPQNDLTYDRIEREIRLNENIYSYLLTKYQDAKIRQAEQAKEASVLEYAIKAEECGSDGKISQAACGALLSGLIGSIVLLLWNIIALAMNGAEEAVNCISVSFKETYRPFAFIRLVYKSSARKSAPRFVGDGGDLFNLLPKYDAGLSLYPRDAIFSACRYIFI